MQHHEGPDAPPAGGAGAAPGRQPDPSAPLHDDARERLNRQSFRQLVLLLILTYSTFAGTRVVLALAGLQLSGSTFVVGMILSLFSLLPAMLSVWIGKQVDRIGMRGPMLAACLLMVFGAAAPFAIWHVGAMYVTAMCVGLGFLVFTLCVQKAAGELGDEERRKVHFSQLALGFSISGFIGPTMTGLLIDHTGFRTTFLCLALFPLGSWLWLRRFDFARRLPHRPPPAPPPSARQSVWDLLGHPELKRLYVAVVMVSAAWDVHQFLVPLYGATAGMSASQIGFILGAFSVATFVIRLVLPGLARRLSEWPLILTAMVTAALVYAVYPFLPGFGAMLTMSFVLGLGLGLSQPLVLTVLHRVTPAGRVGEAAGLRLMLVNCTQTCLPTAFGAISGALGMAPLFCGMAALIAGGAVYAGRPRRGGRS
ncbi:MAG: MFS transporter [Burkholderiaceae bacterium]